jgi:glycosyltransferase involved in cell wall biosynthesis
MILSILVTTIPERRTMFLVLQQCIFNQIYDCLAAENVEVLHDASERGIVTTGEKRNCLLERAGGKYFWFVDDDDMILPGAVKAILKASESDCDVMAINGIMTTEGKNEKRWFISLQNPYEAQLVNGREIYLRYPNHITPMKTELVRDIKFPDKSNFEDKAWADLVKASRRLKTETKIDIPVYHYRYSHFNKTYV